MKRAATILWFVAIAFIALSRPVYSQAARDIFNSPETPVTYLGVDFSQARLIGDAEAIPEDFKTKYFPGINLVVINEPKKYDIPKALKRSTITNDISVTDAVNSKIEADKIKSSGGSDENRLDAAAIANIVNSYDLSGKSGIGMVFIVENLNKTSAKGSMYVTFIDMASKKVLFTERLTGKAGGFGYKNYWAKTVYEVLEQIEKSKYKEWKTKNP
ncbi:MAG: hypothetical protein ACXWCG_10115 [Flavitalea sp.]